ncbi:hypothetical protein C2E21_8194 [Chlorella sorokiniana]|uniref:Uncharacterized protein n=1 Tax=Chlorella sorokiniana TaxID=3076 RepID=A0A2P6TFB5_CHLSO|nr:hypothetical protein C2E21_8194 [Chlorella sorokiniana]|eukprot:PRW32664.1 hypothetical protein C2E21_8194 [Chlorella sorokiniana]
MAAETAASSGGGGGSSPAASPLQAGLQSGVRGMFLGLVLGTIWGVWEEKKFVLRNCLKEYHLRECPTRLFSIMRRSVTTAPVVATFLGVNASLRCWWHNRQVAAGEAVPAAPLAAPLQGGQQQQAQQQQTQQQQQQAQQQQPGFDVLHPVMAGAAGTAAGAVRSLGTAIRPVMRSRPAVRAAPRARLAVTAAAAATSAAPAAAASTARQHSNLVPFVRPGSASQNPMVILDDQVPETFVAPPPTGRRTAPLMVAAAPVSYGACTGDAWRAPAIYINVNENVSDCFGGLEPAECHEVCYLHLGNTISALDAAATSLSPPTAARTLRHLAAEAPALALIAPGGTSGLAALPACQLPELFQRAAACAAELTAAGAPTAAIDTALAAVQLLSSLRFGSAAAVQPYAAAVCALKATLAAAASSPAASISERHVLCLLSACARADSHLWLTPWICQRWTAATEARLTAGWSSGEAAVQFFECWCALVARRRLHFAPAKFQAAAEAAVGHEDLTTAQLSRLLAAEAALPADLTTTVNAWLAGWTAGVSSRRASSLVRAQAKAAAGTAARARRAAAHSAAAAVELALGAPAMAAFA